jgi:hypothetical protein
MTEAEWLLCDDPGRMLDFALASMSERKRRLFAVARARMVWHLLEDERSREAVEVTERHADGGADDDALKAAGVRADVAQYEFWDLHGQPHNHGKSEHWDASVLAFWATHGMDALGEGLSECGILTGLGVPLVEQANLLRDLMRHPASRPGHLGEPGPDAMRMALHAYEARDWAVLPVLADALEEGGCSDTALLSHLRSGGTHTRGCWALDLVLGKP